jgi:hypothetical protein
MVGSASKQKWVPGIFLKGKSRPAREVENLTVNCELCRKCVILDVLHIFEASTAYYRDSFTFCNFYIKVILIIFPYFSKRVYAFITQDSLHESILKGGSWISLSNLYERPRILMKPPPAEPVAWPRSEPCTPRTQA